MLLAALAPHTPQGPWSTSCLHQVPNDGTLIRLPKFHGQGVTLIHANGSSTYLPPCEETPRKRLHRDKSSANAGSHSYPVIFYGTSQPIKSFTGTLTVPSVPKVWSTQTVHWWFGVEDAKGTAVIQPVLTWMPAYANRWVLASWNCCPAGHQFYGELFWVNVGETVKGSIESTGGESYQVESTTPRGEQSVLRFDDSLEFTLPLLSMETYNTSADCTLLPPSRMSMQNLSVSPAVDSWGSNTPVGFDLKSHCGWSLDVSPSALVAMPGTRENADAEASR